MVCTLLGKSKGSHNVDHHFINLAHESVSGLNLAPGRDGRGEGRTRLDINTNIPIRMNMNIHIIYSHVYSSQAHINIYILILCVVDLAR